MAARITLTKDKEALADVLEWALYQGKTFRNPMSVEWKINHWYLQGVRRFSAINYETGYVQMTYESPEGNMELRYEDCLIKFQRELGRLIKIKTGPKCTPKGLSLEGHRKSAMAQVILDELVVDTRPTEIKTQLVEGILTYGTMGLGTWVNKEIGASIDVQQETIPPWELIPMPARPVRAGETKGLIRHRYVPLNWLRDQQPNWKIPTHQRGEQWGRMDITYVSPGEKQVDDDSVDEFSSGGVAGANMHTDRDHGRDERTTLGKEAGSKRDEPYVQLIECWVPDPHYRVERYVAMLGRHVVHDATWEKTPWQQRPCMPISIVRYNHAGGWWGRSFVGPLVPLNMEAEVMLGNLFKNMADLDYYGTTGIPATWGVKKEHLGGKTRSKYFMFEPDYTAPNLDLKRISPNNIGDAPGKTAATANIFIDRLSRESPMYSGQSAGRMDSASGTASSMRLP